MILHDFECTEGHRFEAGVDASVADPSCPACGAATRRRYTGVRIGGRASAGVPRDQMPRSWQSIGRGHPDAVAHWRRAVEHRERIEEKDPDLAGDRRPVLAHEGIFASNPLRLGDDVPSAVQQAVAGSAKAAAAESGAASAAPGTTTSTPHNHRRSSVD